MRERPEPPPELPGPQPHLVVCQEQVLNGRKWVEQERRKHLDVVGRQLQSLKVWRPIQRRGGRSQGFGCSETHLQPAESSKGVVAQEADAVVVQVEVRQTRTGGEAAVREGGEPVGAQAEDAEGGEQRGATGGHLRDLTEAWVRQRQPGPAGCGLTWFPVRSTS